MKYDPSTASYDKIVAYICSALNVTKIWRRSNNEVVATLSEHPPGYLRCFAMFMVDAITDNNGSREVFTSGNGVLVPYAIEGFKRVGADEMAEILSLASQAWTMTPSELSASLPFSLPGRRLVGNASSSVEKVLKELDALYWKADKRFQGGKVLHPYPHVAINRYWEAFPEDFGIEAV